MIYRRTQDINVAGTYGLDRLEAAIPIGGAVQQPSLPEPPWDNNVYGIRNGIWVRVPGEPPNDGNIYGRMYGQWVIIGTYVTS